MPRAHLTPQEREQRRRARWDAILRQHRPYVVPTVDEVVEEFRRRFGRGLNVDAYGGTAGKSQRYFGLRAPFTAAELKSAFRRKIMQVHPDRGGSEAAARECIAHFDALEYLAR